MTKPNPEPGIIPDNEEELITTDHANGGVEVILSEYICERCGYHYKKATDFAPFLCYRCMRFIAKKVFVVMHTIQPPTSRTVAPEV